LGARISMLERALASVRHQGDGVHLVVVVPQGKKDARALARSFDATVVDDPGRGMSAAINAGLAARTGERFYIWLGDDDAYCPGGLSSLKALLQNNPRAVVAYGACDYVRENGDVVWRSRAGRLARWMLGLGPNLIPHLAALIRLDELLDAGGYDEDLRFVMDLDAFLKLKKKGPFVSTPEVISQFGWHRQSLTVQDRKKSSGEARMVKRRHLPGWAKPIEPLWEFPVQWASALMARSLNRPGRAR
jgi:Glycosyl transferase family 2.